MHRRLLLLLFAPLLSSCRGLVRAKPRIARPDTVDPLPPLRARATLTVNAVLTFAVAPGYDPSEIALVQMRGGTFLLDPGAGMTLRADDHAIGAVISSRLVSTRVTNITVLRHV